MPHRNVSIVIFYTGDGKLLLQDRKGIAKFGEDYDFFGGGIEEGEGPRQAILRELKEELDYVPHDLKFFKRFEFKIDANDSRTEYVFMSKSPKMGSIKVLEGKAAKLFTVQEALKLKLFPHDEDIIREFARAKGFLLQ
ncbi:NUDIX domain-containing protein [Candidatus Woesearchaeota archaeon]|nr:NUDIX domain-containing protein [Candidatus Woesearchaeota archaeon]